MEQRRETGRDGQIGTEKSGLKVLQDRTALRTWVTGRQIIIIV